MQGLLGRAVSGSGFACGWRRIWAALPCSGSRSRCFARVRPRRRWGAIGAYVGVPRGVGGARRRPGQTCGPRQVVAACPGPARGSPRAARALRSLVRVSPGPPRGFSGAEPGARAGLHQSQPRRCPRGAWKGAKNTGLNDALTAALNLYKDPVCKFSDSFSPAFSAERVGGAGRAAGRILRAL